MSRRHLVLLGLTVVCIAAPSVTVAEERTHRVGPGESASSIAKHYYGDYELAGLLLEYNGKQGTVIQVGESLRVPLCEEHRIRPGDAWSVLAQRYLGRADVWPSVARLNGLLPEQPLRVGQRLIFPVVLDHPLERGETLAVLAERYYGEIGLSRVLQEFNGFDDPRRLSVGETVEIPLVSLQSQRGTTPDEPSPLIKTAEIAPEAEDRAPAKPTPAVATPLPEPTPPRPRFAGELRSVSLVLAAGDFKRARSMLEKLEQSVIDTGTDADRVELWRLRAYVHVAYDEQEQACEAYRSLSSIQTSDDLDADLVSPKIRDAFTRCGLVSDNS
jgi:LysM repeat protein